MRRPEDHRRMHGGFTKHCCFLCLWDSRATAEHYVRKDWPANVTYIPGNANIKEVPLVQCFSTGVPRNTGVPRETVTCSAKISLFCRA